MAWVNHLQVVHYNIIAHAGFPMLRIVVLWRELALLAATSSRGDDDLIPKKVMFPFSYFLHHPIHAFC